MKGWIHFLSLLHQEQPVPIHAGHLATQKTNLIPTFLGKSSYPRISLCDVAWEHLKEERKKKTHTQKNTPRQTDELRGEQKGQSSGTGARALTWWTSSRGLWLT